MLLTLSYVHRIWPMLLECLRAWRDNGYRVPTAPRALVEWEIRQHDSIMAAMTRLLDVPEQDRMAITERLIAWGYWKHPDRPAPEPRVIEEQHEEFERLVTEGLEANSREANREPTSEA